MKKNADDRNREETQKPLIGERDAGQSDSRFAEEREAEARGQTSEADSNKKSDADPRVSNI